MIQRFVIEAEVNRDLSKAERKEIRIRMARTLNIGARTFDGAVFDNCRLDAIDYFMPLVEDSE